MTEMTTEVGPEFAAALLSAQRQVKSALKGSENKHHGYRYASAEEVLLVAREALNANALVLTLLRVVYRPLAAEHGGALGHLCCEYLLLHESGQRLCSHVEEAVVPTRSTREGWSRPLDKAQFAARTEALGYVLRDLLLIPRSDTPDVGGRRDGEAGAYQRPVPRPVPQLQKVPLPRLNPDPVSPPKMSLQEAETALRSASTIAEAEAALLAGRAATRGTPEETLIDMALAHWVNTALAGERGGPVGQAELDILAQAVTAMRPRGPAAVQIRALFAEARKRFSDGE